MDALAIGLVGLAVLTPSLFEEGAAGTARDVALIAVAPVITDGQRAAMAVLRGAIAGIPTALPADDLQALHRFVEVRDSLAPMRGAADDNPLMPAVTDADLDAIVGAFTDAVKAGNAADRESYSLVLGVGSIAVMNSFEVVATGIVDRDGLTPLGQALRDALDLRDSLLSWSGVNEAPGANMLVVAKLAIEMDNVGYRVTGALSNTDPKPIDSLVWAAGELPTTLDDATSAAANAVGGAIGGAAGNLVGGFLFSTPVLIGVVGYLAYRSMK